MANTQTDLFGAAAIESAGDARMDTGVHLRWAFDPATLTEFPSQGFRVFRRLGAIKQRYQIRHRNRAALRSYLWPQGGG